MTFNSCHCTRRFIWNVIRNTKTCSAVARVHNLDISCRAIQHRLDLADTTLQATARHGNKVRDSAQLICIQYLQARHPHTRTIPD